MANQGMLPELVQDFRLETKFEDDRRITIHTTPWGRRIASRREVWVQEKILGHGGYGLVWLQRNMDKNGSTKLRAVKEIRLYKHKVDDKDYIRELEALAKFSHNKYTEFFVKFYGWYNGPESLFIAMEYCEHGSLAEYLHRHRTLPESQAQYIASQVLGGLTSMHEQGFAHRDLKPANLLIQSQPPDDWWVKICDLGLTKRIGDAIESTTVRGTPGFMPPETIGLNGNPRIVNPFFADMWCFGETVFRMLTGQQTFKSLYSLHEYQLGHSEFPVSALSNVNASDIAIDFLHSTMMPKPSERLTAAKALEHTWVQPATGEQSNSTEFVNLQSGIRSNLWTSDISLPNQSTQASRAWTTSTQSHATIEKSSLNTSPSQNVVMPSSSMFQRDMAQSPAAEGHRMPSSPLRRIAHSEEGGEPIELPSFTQANINEDTQSKNRTSPKPRYTNLFSPPMLAGGDQTARGAGGPDESININSSETGRRNNVGLSKESPLSSDSGQSVLHEDNDKTRSYRSQGHTRSASMRDKSLGHARRESILQRRMRREAAQEANVFEDTDQELNKSEISLDRLDEIELSKPVHLKGLFSVSTTSGKSVLAIREDIKRVLRQLNVDFIEIKGGFSCRHSPSIDSLSRENGGSSSRVLREMSTYVQSDLGGSMILEFEIFIVKVPLLSLYGIQFKRMTGNTWQYKNMADQILRDLRL